MMQVWLDSYNVCFLDCHQVESEGVSCDCFRANALSTDLKIIAASAKSKK